MRVAAILEEVNRRGILLEADGDNLRYRAPKGSLTPELREALIQHKAEIVPVLTSSKSQGETARVPARVRGKDAVVESSQVEVCWHCHGEKICRCALCAVPGTESMPWQPGECQSCQGAGYLTDAQPKPGATTAAGCPGPDRCQGCYRVGKREDGTPIRLHPPRGKAIGWSEWKLATEKVQ